MTTIVVIGRERGYYVMTTIVVIGRERVKEVNRLRETYRNDFPQYPVQLELALSESLPVVLRTISLKQKKKKDS